MKYSVWIFDIEAVAHRFWFHRKAVRPTPAK
jgi:hypothetical protein